MSKNSIKNIIVGVDLSDYSKKVVKEAQHLAEKMNSELVYVHAITIDHFKSAFNAETSNLTAHFENEVRQKYGLINETTVVIRFGRPYEEIIAVAKLYQRPMIVVGHRGTSAIARFFLGSNVERIALISPYPVWIHRGLKTILPHRILVPSDLDSRSVDMVSGIKSFQKTFDSKYELYHVTPQPPPLLDIQNYGLIVDGIKKADDRDLKKFKRKNPSLKVVQASGQIVDKIQTHSKKFDVIAISPTQRKKSSPFFGGVTAKIIRSGDKPILVLPL